MVSFPNAASFTIFFCQNSQNNDKPTFQEIFKNTRKIQKHTVLVIFCKSKKFNDLLVVVAPAIGGVPTDPVPFFVLVGADVTTCGLPFLSPPLLPLS